MNLNLLNDLLNELLVCACDSLESGVCPGQEADCGCPCRMFISVGPPVWDSEACCGQGQLTAHVDRVYPVGNFPSQNNQVNLCQTPLAADVVITLLRCYPTMDEHGTVPTHLELQAAGESLNRDLFILTTGLLCCLSAKKRMQKFVFLGAREVGPQGGCAGIELRFTIELNN